MKPSRFLLAASLCAAIVLPVIVSAQQADQTAPSSGTVTGTTSTDTTRPHHQPGLARRALRGVALTDAQKQQIQTLVQQYGQDHPAGSARDPQAAKALRASLLNVLTPDQQATYLQNLAKFRKRHKAAGAGDEGLPSPTPSPQ